MRLYTTVGILTMMGGIVGCVIGICIAEFMGLKDINRLWIVTPLVITGAFIGGWIEGKPYND